jgi:hypothetical protein
MSATLVSLLSELWGEIVDRQDADSDSPIADIREHAIFTLRYLLQDNLDSQQYIAKLQPVGHSGQ